MNVVLLGTGRLPKSYFETVRSDLGDGPDLTIDVIAWAPPHEPVDEVVRRFLLVGPGRMPEAAAPTAAPAAAPPGTALAQSAVPATTAQPAKHRRVGLVAQLRKLRVDKVARKYWWRIRSRNDALSMVDNADIVIALDWRSARAGWHLARRPAGTTVVLGVAAAVRKLSQ